MKNKLFKTSKLIIILSVILIYLFSIPANAQEKNKTINLGTEYSMYSKVLNEERTFQVYFPDSYDGQSTKYPVIYLLDGGFHFHHASYHARPASGIRR